MVMKHGSGRDWIKDVAKENRLLTIPLRSNTVFLFLPPAFLHDIVTRGGRDITSEHFGVAAYEGRPRFDVELSLIESDQLEPSCGISITNIINHLRPPVYCNSHLFLFLTDVTFLVDRFDN